MVGRQAGRLKWNVAAEALLEWQKKGAGFK